MNVVALIPSYDMLGLPAPALLLRLLMALTLALHWLFLGAAVGGIVVVAISTLGSYATREETRRIHGIIIPQLPFFLALAMTLGVAPLLFVQVLYGNLFYTANILQAFWWLSLVPLVITIFYLFYFAWYRLKGGNRLDWKIPFLLCALFFVCASILAANATLLQTPTAWPAMRLPFQGVRLYHGDPTLLARLGMAFAGFIAIGGLVYAGVPQLKSDVATADRNAAWQRGLSLAAPAALLHGLAAAFFVYRLPPAQRNVLTAGSGESCLFYGAAVLLIAATVLLFLSKKPVKSKTAVLAGLCYFLALLATAWLRDLLRQTAIAPFFQVESVPVHLQTDSFALWTMVFIAGLAVVGYMLRLASQPKATG